MKPTVNFTRDDGKTFGIGADNAFALTAIDGIGAPAVELSSEKPAQGDGAVVTGSRVDARTIDIVAKNRFVSLNASMREAAARFFVPGHTYNLSVTYEGHERSVDCWIKKIKLPTESTWKPLELSLTMLCESGWLNGGGLNGENINGVRGGFGFPFVSLIIGSTLHGFPWGVYNFQKSIEIDNDGDTDSWIRSVITASGPVTNPKIIHGSAYVRVMTTMAAGDVIEIDTEHKTVTKNGSNALNLVDKSSFFSGMKMGLGMNTISFAADTGDNLLDVTVYWYKKFGGV